MPVTMCLVKGKGRRRDGYTRAFEIHSRNCFVPILINIKYVLWDLRDMRFWFRSYATEINYVDSQNNLKKTFLFGTCEHEVLMFALKNFSSTYAWNEKQNSNLIVDSEKRETQ